MSKVTMGSSVGGFQEQYDNDGLAFDDDVPGGVQMRGLDSNGGFPEGGHKRFSSNALEDNEKKRRGRRHTQGGDSGLGEASYPNQNQLGESTFDAAHGIDLGGDDGFDEFDRSNGMLDAGSPRHGHNVVGITDSDAV
jgi:hypothetical protein